MDQILAAVSIPVQLGGGIRTLQTMENWLTRGVRRVILGTVALHQPELVKEACRLFPGQIAVGIDAREGYVAVSGWAESSTVRALDLALRYEDCGVAAIIYTDINRDGAMAGVNVEATADLAFTLTTPVIASGGVCTLEHMVEGIREGHAIAVLAASIFHFGLFSIAETKAAMAAAGLPVRITTD